MTMNHQENDQLRVSAHWLQVLLQGFSGLGLDSHALLATAGIRAQELKVADARIDLTRTLKLWQAAAQACEGSLGLKLSEYLTPLHFPLLAMNLMHSRCLLDALAMAGRYSAVISEGGSFALEEKEGLITLMYNPASDGFSRHQIDAVLLLLKRFGEWLYCRSVPPARVLLGFEVQEDAKEEYTRAYGCLPEFGASCHALVYESGWFRRPLPGGDPVLAQMHRRMLEEQMERVQQPAVRIRVERSLQEAVHLATDREEIAAKLNMSGSTLQRRLAEAGTSFQQLLETERERRATQLLSFTRLPLADISELLGFADSSAFSKAFRRWQGMSPLQYRQKQ